MAKSKVLFLCRHNSIRSQMAEAFLRRYAEDRFEIFSAGLEPKDINPYTYRMMDEIGIDIHNQTSEPVKNYMGQMDFRYVIIVCPLEETGCPTPLWFMGEKLQWPFDDPAEATGSEAEIMAKFREVRDQIDGKIKTWLAEIEMQTQ